MKYDRIGENITVKTAIAYYKAIKAYMVQGSLYDVLNSMINELSKYVVVGPIPSDWLQLATTLVSDLALMESTARENDVVDPEFFASIYKAWNTSSYIVKLTDQMGKLPTPAANDYFKTIRNSLTDAAARIAPQVQ